MNDESMDIPIGADMSELQKALEDVISAFNLMGETIAKSINTAAASMAAVTANMGGVAQSAGLARGAIDGVGAASSRLMGRLVSTASVAGNVGTAFQGLQSAIGLVSRASRVLMGVNLGVALSGWIQRAGGLRGALRSAAEGMRGLMQSANFRRVVVGVVAVGGAIVGLRTATRAAAVAIGGLRSFAVGVFASISAMASRTAGAVRGAFSGLKGALGGISVGLPIAGLVGGAGVLALFTSQLFGAVKQAAKFETMRVSVEHFTGSVAEANRLLSEMADFGLKTPFETMDLQEVATGLLGSGIRENVGGLTKDLAALAKNAEELKAFGDAMGKGFAKGKFQTDDLNKFLERQVNLMPALADQTGLVGDELRNAIEKGLGFSDVAAAIASMSREGGQFFGLLERRSFTMEGLFSTLSSAMADVRKAFGAPILDALRPIITDAISGVGSLMDGAKKMGEAFRDAIGVAFQAFKQGRMTEFLEAGLVVAVESATNVLQRGFSGAVAFLKATLPPIFDAATAKLRDSDFWFGVAKIFDGIGDGFSARLEEALPWGDQKLVDTYKSFSKGKMEFGGYMIGKAGKGDMGKTLEDAMNGGAAAWAEAMANFKSSPYLVEAEKSFAEIFESLKDSSDKAIEKAKKKTEGKEKDGGSSSLPSSRMGFGDPRAMIDSVVPAVLSLARIGGGDNSGVGRMMFHNLIAESRVQSRILREIAVNTKGGGGKTAVYA